MVLGKSTHLCLSLPPPLRRVISRVQMFFEISSHTHLMANNFSCLPSLSVQQAAAALTGPTACLQPVYKGSAAALLRFSPVSQRAETERLKTWGEFGSKSFSAKLDFLPKEEFHLHLYAKLYSTEQKLSPFLKIYKNWPELPKLPAVNFHIFISFLRSFLIRWNHWAPWSLNMFVWRLDLTAEISVPI